jgi:ABC-type Fe3+-hydroxamate transport system substrate-binding protein
MQFSDQDNSFKAFVWHPKARIISLVPSITELLFDLGLGPNLIARTKYCVHPAKKIDSLPIIGGTKNIDIEKILELKPDLIIANKEENTKNQILSLSKLVNTVLSDIPSFSHAIHFIQFCGQLFQQQQLASNIVQNIHLGFKQIHQLPVKKVLYLIWRNPFMSVTQNTFIHSMLQQIGFENCVANFPGNYPVLQKNVLQSLHPEIIFLPSEPYHFQEEHIHELKEIFPNARFFFVDGEMFSWYGSRMIKAAQYFYKFIPLWKS